LIPVRSVCERLSVQQRTPQGGSRMGVAVSGGHRGRRDTRTGTALERRRLERWLLPGSAPDLGRPGPGSPRAVRPFAGHQPPHLSQQLGELARRQVHGVAAVPFAQRRAGAWSRCGTSGSTDICAPPRIRVGSSETVHPSENPANALCAETLEFSAARGPIVGFLS
jgi:hypothetical protein